MFFVAFLVLALSRRNHRHHRRSRLVRRAQRLLRRYQELNDDIPVVPGVPQTPAQGMLGYMPVFQYNPTPEQMARYQQKIAAEQGQTPPSFFTQPVQGKTYDADCIRHGGWIDGKPCETPVPIYFAIGAVPDDQ